jgi:DNA-directed RNA polymerase subunit beta'
VNPTLDQSTAGFSEVELKLASPDDIMKWSHGEVTKPETINYRTQKPEKDGLFDERIFGPTKDWECYCGKYKRIRYKGVICDKCGVELTRSIVRRERMGHIRLAVPVVHIWFLRGTPSSIGLLLNLSVRDLERITYFANYIITEVSEDAKKAALESIEQEFKTRKTEIEANRDKTRKELEKNGATEKELAAHAKEFDKELESLEGIRVEARSDIQAIEVGEIITEVKYRDLAIKYGEVFQAAIGAEGIYQMLREIDLEKLRDELRAEESSTAGQRRKKALRRLRLVEGMLKTGLKPDWMIMTVLPVIPPDLRPMVQLDGGRFAASDLNDLYRRVINRNNRLKRLIELGAPEVICRNEKRMLQEAVDALIDNNARRERAVSQTGGSRRKLKSLSDMLKGKQGRFRQNLLGKRVDYSGRSVIVVGPDLKLHQCGIPKRMALELFKPFVIGRLIAEGYAHNVKAASRLIERARNEVWDMLEEVIKDKYVLLNRAPTLHRLGIQAFQPVLIEGKAIQIHPLVCHAFNADFDGDQMAVHVPLSIIAQHEAREIMLSSKNLLKPSAGEPVINPTQDIVLGCYYISQMEEGAKGEGRAFASPEESSIAYQMRTVSLRARVKVKIGSEVFETTPGRVMFNQILPAGMAFVNDVLDYKRLKAVAAECFERFGVEATAKLVDDIKTIGFRYSTVSGISIGVDDIHIPTRKKEIIVEAEARVDEINNQYQAGLITDHERYLLTVDLWTKVKAEIQKELEAQFDRGSSVWAMMDSGARGNIDQIGQLAGMKGMVSSPTGRKIELAIKSNYKEGLSALEYFISTHGARKGLTDTALRTSESGYLTRRLVDVAQDVVVIEENCGDTVGTTLSLVDSREMGENFQARIRGRFALARVLHPETGEVLVKKDQLISDQMAEKIEELQVPEVRIRSIVRCRSRWGACQKCYGVDLATGKLVKVGEAVGVMAAQSIGEPGTQLTMKTFHTGGIVGVDITQGLPRVEELFEARAPKGEATISELDGTVEISGGGAKRVITVMPEKMEELLHELGGRKAAVKTGDTVNAGDVLASKDGQKDLLAKIGGQVKVGKEGITVRGGKYQPREHAVPQGVGILVTSGEKVVRGQKLTEGNVNLADLLLLNGEEAVERYLIGEVQTIYASQGQTINDKHLEVIVRQMFSRIQITEAGGSELIPGEIVSRSFFEETSEELEAEGKAAPKGERLLLPISKVAHYSDSFLSAASFQETTRVLIQAAVSGQVDKLRGLKENVIIGRLIPVGTGYQGGAGNPVVEAALAEKTRLEAELAREREIEQARLEAEAEAAAEAEAGALTGEGEGL